MNTRKTKNKKKMMISKPKSKRKSNWSQGKMSKDSFNGPSKTRYISMKEKASQEA